MVCVFSHSCVCVCTCVYLHPRGRTSARVCRGRPRHRRPACVGRDSAPVSQRRGTCEGRDDLGPCRTDGTRTNRRLKGTVNGVPGPQTSFVKTKLRNPKRGVRRVSPNVSPVLPVTKEEGLLGSSTRSIGGKISRPLSLSSPGTDPGGPFTEVSWCKPG